MLKLSINPRTTTTTKINGGKFKLHEKSLNNLKQNSNQKSLVISNRSRSKIKNCMLTLAEVVEDNKKRNCTQQAVVASAETLSQSATYKPSTSHYCGALCAISKIPIAYFTTLTTIKGTTEIEAKKFLNIYLTQLRKSINHYLWTVEQSLGGIIHFHILTFEESTPNWKNITKNWFKDASRTEPIATMQQFKKILNYILKDETKQTIVGRKYGTSKSIHAYKPVEIQITSEQYQESKPIVISESEWFQVSKSNQQIQKALRQYYKNIYLAKQSATQTSIEAQIKNIYGADASQGFDYFGFAVPPLVPI